MELIPAAGADAATLAAARAIYEDAFPPPLGSPFDDVLRDEALVLVAGGTAAGIAVLRPLADTGWTFLRYVAIGARGQGLGSRMWPLLLAHCAAAGHDRLLLDVEDPDEPGITAADRELHERRIGFYRRLGVVLLPVRGYQPPHDGHPHPMRLMATATAPDAPLPAAPADVRAMLLAVHEHRYGLAPDDPLTLRVLAASEL